MTTWLRVREIARLTNLSRRYWQRRFAAGDVPGARQVEFGRRRLFIAERRLFEPWWANQLHEISAVQRTATTPPVATTVRVQRRRRAGAAVDPRQSEFGFQRSSPGQLDNDRHDP
jgi:hypothetical protein